jgi:transposase
LNELEVRYLRGLLADLEIADEFRRRRAEEIEDFVLEMRELGSSARGMADSLGVSPSTIQVWTKRARRRRG